MGLPEIMTHVQGLVDGVAGASRCHLGLRRFATPELLIVAGQPAASTYPDLHLWFLQRTTAAEERLGFSGNTRAYQLILEGYRQARDPTEAADAAAIGTTMTTEVAFSAEVEAICDALRNDTATHGGELATGADPPQVTIWDYQVIQTTPDDLGTGAEGESIECHHAQITVTVRAELGVTLV